MFKDKPFCICSKGRMTHTHIFVNDIPICAFSFARPTHFKVHLPTTRLLVFYEKNGRRYQRISSLHFLQCLKLYVFFCVRIPLVSFLLSISIYDLFLPFLSHACTRIYLSLLLLPIHANAMVLGPLTLHLRACVTGPSGSFFNTLSFQCRFLVTISFLSNNLILEDTGDVVVVGEVIVVSSSTMASKCLNRQSKRLSRHPKVATTTATTRALYQSVVLPHVRTHTRIPKHHRSHNRSTL